MRTTCLYCEQKSKRTVLIQTVRGGVCPECNPGFLDTLRTNALATIGLPPRPTLLGKGVRQV